MAITLDIQKQLGEFSLDIHAVTDSKRIGILGASGCGKSMTLKCIAGIEKPDRGIIKLEDSVLYDSEHKINPRPQQRNVGYLFQNYALFPTMTVQENIGIGVRNSKQNKKSGKIFGIFGGKQEKSSSGILKEEPEKKNAAGSKSPESRQNQEKIRYLVEKFRLEGLEKRYPSELSGGQQQRVALARIMAYEPDAILLDEPFSALDVYLKEQLQHELSEMLADYTGTVIMVSHSRDEIYRFSDELMIMDHGKTISFGKTKDIFANPGRKAAARLTGCKNIVPVIRADMHTLSVPDWNIFLSLKQDIPEDIRYIGIHSHDFMPEWGEKPGISDSSDNVLSPVRGEEPDNCLPVFSAQPDELPFEKRYYIKTSENQKEEIYFTLTEEAWKKIEKDGMPVCLRIPEEKILLLRD